MNSKKHDTRNHLSENKGEYFGYLGFRVFEIVPEIILNKIKYFISGISLPLKGGITFTRNPLPTGDPDR
jgi:hypothetical protein